MPIDRSLFRKYASTTPHFHESLLEERKRGVPRQSSRNFLRAIFHSSRVSAIYTMRFMRAAKLCAWSRYSGRMQGGWLSINWNDKRAVCRVFLRDRSRYLDYTLWRDVQRGMRASQTRWRILLSNGKASGADSASREFRDSAIREAAASS